jgi:antitoxin ParD1/3/4
METMQIALPAPLKEFIDAEVTSGRYGSASAFIQDLVGAAQRCKAQEELEAQLLEGLVGPSREVTPEWWDAFHERMRQRHAAKAAS